MLRLVEDTPKKQSNGLLKLAALVAMGIVAWVICLALLAILGLFLNYLLTSL